MNGAERKKKEKTTSTPSVSPALCYSARATLLGGGVAQSLQPRNGAIDILYMYVAN